MDQSEPVWSSVTASRRYSGVADDVRAHDGGDDSAHEGVHQINSIVRNRYSTHVNAAYVLNDKAAVMVEPAITLSDVANAVSAELRGGGYQLYLVEQARYWNDSPLYVFDEWSAYIIGAMAYRKAGDDGNYRLSKERAREFANYAAILIDVVHRKTSGYDSTQLRAVYAYLLMSTGGLA